MHIRNSILCVRYSQGMIWDLRLWVLVMVWMYSLLLHSWVWKLTVPVSRLRSFVRGNAELIPYRLRLLLMLLLLLVVVVLLLLLVVLLEMARNVRVELASLLMLLLKLTTSLSRR